MVASFQPGTSVSGVTVECSVLAWLNFRLASSTRILAWMKRFHLACWISAYPVPVKCGTPVECGISSSSLPAAPSASIAHYDGVKFIIIHQQLTKLGEQALGHETDGVLQRKHGKQGRHFFLVEI